VRVIILATGS